MRKYIQQLFSIIRICKYKNIVHQILGTVIWVNFGHFSCENHLYVIAVYGVAYFYKLQMTFVP